jgi:tight adherence protein C
VKRRRSDTSREFPFFLDTLVMLRQAGANLDQALQIYARGNSNTTLSRDVVDALNRVQAGSALKQAIEEMLDRIVVNEIKVTVRGIIEAEDKGAEQIHFMQESADDLRGRRWEAAERAAQVLQAKMVMPMMLIMMSILIFVLTPAFTEVARSGLF